MCLSLFGYKKRWEACDRDRALLIEELIQCQSKAPKPLVHWEIRSSVWVRAVLEIMVREGCELEIMPLVDEQYRILSERDFKIAIMHIELHRRKYEAIWFDCDEFAEIAPALLTLEFEINSCAQVLDLSSMHAYGVGVVLEGAGIYEPQRAWFSRDIAGRDKGMYGMERTSPNGYVQI